MQYQFRPLENWSGPKYRTRKDAAFRSSWSSTLDLLGSELAKLRARQIVIEADVSAEEIRQDGMLRANARPETPRIRLSFDSWTSKGPLSFPCDSYRAWQDNVRAIALSLECLRSVDRYGVTRGTEQYQGWLANLALLSGWHLDGEPLVAVRVDLAGAVKAARVRWHPDKHGGDDRIAREVNALAERLGVK